MIRRVDAELGARTESADRWPNRGPNVRRDFLVNLLEMRTVSTSPSPGPGFHLYYPSRKQASPAFSLVVDALRYRPAPRR